MVFNKDSSLKVSETSLSETFFIDVLLKPLHYGTYAEMVKLREIMEKQITEMNI